MELPSMSSYSVAALVHLAEKNVNNDEYYNQIKEILCEKISILKAYELCKIVEEANKPVLREAALEALSQKDIDEEFIELCSFRMAMDQMDTVQLWRLASPDRDTDIGYLTKQYLLKSLDQYGYDIKEEEEYRRKQ